MRYSLLFLLLVTSQLVYAVESITSYQESLTQFLKKSKSAKSPFSEADRVVMEKASKSLAVSMPNPGIKVGEKAPDFTLSNALGKKVNLKNELNKGPVVLVFYRGAWCPFCNMHLHALQQRLPQFKKYGAQLITVTPQTPDKSAAQIKKDGYPFEVLSDLDNKAMQDFKLYFELPDDLIAVYKKHKLDIEAFNGQGRNGLPVPGSFVIDKKGVVRAMQAQTDYTVRMEPAAIVEALKKISEEN